MVHAQNSAANGAAQNGAAPPPSAQPAATEDVNAVIQEQAHRIKQLETTLANQEHTLRHVLSMLIEWLEEEDLEGPARPA